MAIRLDDPTNDYLNRSTTLPRTGYTLSGWFYIPTVGAAHALRNIYSSNTNQDGLTVTAAAKVAVNVQSNNATTTGTTTLSAATWYHIAMVRETTTSLKVYLDGELEITDTTSVGATAPNSTRVGMSANSLVGSNIRIAGFKDWSAALTQDDVRNEMRSLMPRMLDSLYGFYPMFPGSGERTRDYSGTGHDWTATGTLTDEDPPPIPWGSAPILIASAIVNWTKTITPVSASIAITSTRTVTPVSAAISSTDQTRTLTPVSASINTLSNTRTITPMSASISTVANSRTITPVSMAVQVVDTPRTVLVSAAISTTDVTRTVPTAAVTSTSDVERTVLMSAALSTFHTRTIPASASISVTVTNTVPLFASILGDERLTPMTAALSVAGISRTVTPVSAAVTRLGLTRTVTTVSAAIGTVTNTRTIAAFASIALTWTHTVETAMSVSTPNLVRTAPTSFASRVTSSRTVAVSVSVQVTSVRSISTTASISATETRTVSMTVSIAVVQENVVPISAALLQTDITRTVTTVTAALDTRRNVRSIDVSADITTELQTPDGSTIETGEVYVTADADPGLLEN